MISSVPTDVKLRVSVTSSVEVLVEVGDGRQLFSGDRKHLVARRELRAGTYPTVPTYQAHAPPSLTSWLCWIHLP